MPCQAYANRREQRQLRKRRVKTRLDAEGNLKCMIDVARDSSSSCTVRVSSFETSYYARENALNSIVRITSERPSMADQALGEARL